jgi:hypothetical protein
MQARLELMRFPSIFFAIVFALAASLSLGAVLGYTLKPAPRAEVVVVHELGGPASTESGCIWVDGKKGC